MSCLPTLTIVARDPRLHANLVGVRDGIMVLLCRDDMPRGERVVGRLVVDAPMHLIADRVYDILWDK